MVVDRIAKKRQIVASEQAGESARKLPRVAFNREIAAEIVELVAQGIPLVDVTVQGEIVSPGVASRVGVHPATIHRWAARHPAFGDSIARARDAAADLLADKMLGLAQAALDDPSRATACRVAADIYRWQAQIRDPNRYGDRTNVRVTHEVDLAEKLAAARRRVYENDDTDAKPEDE